MPEVAKNKSAVCDFIAKNNAVSIWPVPEPGPNQRGPSCGFYALAYVMKYWHERLQLHGGEYRLTAPLEARTQNAKPTEKPLSEKDKLLKADRAQKGEFSSLRHYGKFHHLTAYGSIFDAEDMVKVAKGESSQYAGQFDAMSLRVDAASFGPTVKKL